MKIVLKNSSLFDRPEIPAKDYEPELSACFMVRWRLEIGPAESETYESYVYTICTPYWIAEQEWNAPIISGWPYNVVLRYDYNAIVSHLKSHIGFGHYSFWETFHYNMCFIAEPVNAASSIGKVDGLSDQL